MLEFVDIDHAQALDTFVQKSKFGHFMQLSAWGRLREDWTWYGILCRAANGSICGTMAVLLHRVHALGQQLIYAPRGPVCDHTDTQTYLQLLQGARMLAREKRGYLLRIDPPVTASDGCFTEFAEQYGFQISQEADFGTFQPKNVYLLDLAGQTEKSVLAQMKQKTRYNLRLAQRRGITVREGSAEDVPAFYALLCQTAERDGFSVRKQSDYARFLQLIPNAKLFLAQKDGVLLAATVGVQMGCHTWYVYGASASEGRESKPNELLQWTMIRWALDGGCTIYDFRGVQGEPVPENPQFGLHRFKEGFGGKFVSYVGQMDLPLKPLSCYLMNAAASIRRITKKVSLI